MSEQGIRRESKRSSRQEIGRVDVRSSSSEARSNLVLLGNHPSRRLDLGLLLPDIAPVGREGGSCEKKGEKEERREKSVRGLSFSHTSDGLLWITSFQRDFEVFGFEKMARQTHLHSPAST